MVWGADIAGYGFRRGTGASGHWQLPNISQVCISFASSDLMLTRLPITRLRLSEGKWWRKTGLPTITVRLCPYQTQSPGHPAGGAHVQTLRGTCASQAGSRGADPWWLRSSSSSQRSLQTLFDGDDYYYIWLYYIWLLLYIVLWDIERTKYQEKEKPA